ncbi:MAG: superoxide dismutase [Bacteroidota bacterium]|nr:superoxide dismutase [Bacteroidota bacterium]
MKKIKFSIVALSIAMIYSCKQKEEVLVEVTTPVEVEQTEEKLGNPADVKAEGVFQVMSLPYQYKDFEPNIDGKTMEVHYSKHYLGYTNNLNKAIEGTPLADKTIEEILKNLDLENKALRNNAGGYYNHNLYWEVLTPSTKELSGVLLDRINADFGSFEEFKKQFTEAASKQFGSGWAWLVVNKDGKLQVGATANQDNPLMPKMSVSGTPILGIDVWEHAYYLKYQNQRAKYIESFFNVINWEVVVQKYQQAIAK